MDPDQLAIFRTSMVRVKNFSLKFGQGQKNFLQDIMTDN